MAGNPRAPEEGALTPAEAPAAKGRRTLVALLQACLAIAVLAGGIVFAGYLLRTGPKAGRRNPEPRALLVSVSEVARSRERAVVHAMGTVRAAQTINLQPRVSGEIVEVTPECIPGGMLKEGSVIARIDPADYQLAVEQQTTEVERLTALLAQRRAELAQRESDVATAASAIQQRASEVLKAQNELVKAEAALRIEQGQQAVARREYELLGKKLSEADLDLVLRKPQLLTAEANCDAARAAKAAAEAARDSAVAAKAAAEAMKQSAAAAVEAAEASKKAAEVALKQAQLDLARTAIRAPFNAIVEAESVDLGSQVSSQTPLASLVGTDEYWVEVSVPVDQLQWLRVPRSRGEEGSTARIYDEAAWGPDTFRVGTVIRLASGLETEGRMARLLVSVPDPLGLKGASARPPALLIGSYVRVEIEGTELDGVVPLDRDLVHEGDQVWVMGADGTLEIRKPVIVFRGRDRLLISGGLDTGDKVVTTNIAAPVPGTPLRTRAAAGAAGPAAKGGEGQ
ncbi:MAG TPA: HlyD family efflux transporter periplasmic adaptor subunit [Planctomycetota bacterium]|nr:HlyD family efflux transporter periplasmic adaptor subunit [Planctomycetota bacterium]HRR81282.1 HlyD family efflux transporter periplasmic adaptor subunit [Planctomycetota bacterium]HRT95995.1 HlyD family efflux transporter periplasmic adaptor subunit [Planctomycetota bacterium]